MSERTVSTAALEADDQYREFEQAISLVRPAGLLFTTDVDPDALWAAYLGNLPEERRQHYNCHCCRHFIQRYGGLLTLQEGGQQSSAVWQIEDPPFFRRALTAMRQLVLGAKVTGVFYSAEKTLGTPQTGEWTHLSMTNPTPWPFRGVQSPSQAMAEKLEDYKMLCHGLADYSREAAEQAVRVLKADALYRGEKTLGVAEWFLKLHNSLKDKPRAKRNLTWLAVATAPAGFCHVRSSMIGTLLDDIKAGLSFEVISKRWKDKMHPLQYQRPQAPPKEGTLKQAEELVAKLGLERSLLRRYATLDDVQVKLWVPRELPETKASGGVFGHLRNLPQKPKQLELPVTTMTWEKFQRTVLSGVLEMEILVPASGSFYGLLTAADPDSPPILQWDGLEGHPRNPVSWYYWAYGSRASDWGLVPGWNPVTCVFARPHAWQEPDRFKHHAAAIHFAIAGCRETKNSSLGLFPETLRTELRGIRSVIEAHSRSGGAANPELGTANGLSLQADSSRDRQVTLRVRTKDGLASYKLDRLD